MRFTVQQVGAILVATASLLVPGRSTYAQERPRPVIDVAAGAYLFPDDGETVQEGFVGGAGRFYVTPRLSVGPEIALVAGNHHRHFIVTGNVTWDFVTSGRPFTPFVVVGGGLYSTREDFFDRGTSTSREGAFTVGGGLRGRLSRRVTAGAEARVGWETHIRVNGFVGIGL